MATRAEQKLKTRRALMDAALAQLSADRGGFGSLSLREVAREAGIAPPTSFYRHFAELDELGLAWWTKAAWLCGS